METAYYLTLFSAAALAWGLCSCSLPPPSAARPTHVKRWRMAGLVQYNDQFIVSDNGSLFSAKSKKKFKLCVCYQRTTLAHNKQFKKRTTDLHHFSFSSWNYKENILDFRTLPDNELIQSERDSICMELESDFGCDALRSHQKSHLKSGRFGVRCSLAADTGCIRAHKRKRARRSSGKQIIQ
ncbi:uncharacterized protein LOC123716509 [Pieris brassicae]|uniref:uncharacterized protein LOC123716509 n=1 Tax=Pieris brassicae TaxID=7116 RepID=UPI001E65E9AE|nr:uncharacterized protein LOC123716509 [Pieris brassicae]